MNFQIFKLVLEKAEEPEIKLSTSAGSSRKQEFQKNIYFCFIDYAKVFDCVDHNKLWISLVALWYKDWKKINSVHLIFILQIKLVSLSSWSMAEQLVNPGDGIQPQDCVAWKAVP